MISDGANGIISLGPTQTEILVLFLALRGCMRALSRIFPTNWGLLQQNVLFLALVGAHRAPKDSKLSKTKKSDVIYPCEEFLFGPDTFQAILSSHCIFINWAYSWISIIAVSTLVLPWLTCTDQC